MDRETEMQRCRETEMQRCNVLTAPTWHMAHGSWHMAQGTRYKARSLGIHVHYELVDGGSSKVDQRHKLH